MAPTREFGATGACLLGPVHWGLQRIGALSRDSGLFWLIWGPLDEVWRLDYEGRSGFAAA
eukprot:354862-Chlamydomonas_euryale.AAC.2